MIFTNLELDTSIVCYAIMIVVVNDYFFVGCSILYYWVPSKFQNYI